MHCKADAQTTLFKSPLGGLILTAKPCALTSIQFQDCLDFSFDLTPESELWPVLNQAKNWLENYFDSKPIPCPCPLELSGTFFQKQVWQILQTIAFGQVCTYGELALRIRPELGKSGHLARAIGQANGKNPCVIAVPCHRVVAANKKLGGYSAGIARKKILLQHEGVFIL
jgi:methylated-DNA-[protein]-cysteine S-methyltransferase